MSSCATRGPVRTELVSSTADPGACRMQDGLKSTCVPQEQTMGGRRHRHRHTHTHTDWSVLFAAGCRILKFLQKIPLTLFVVTSSWAVVLACGLESGIQYSCGYQLLQRAQILHHTAFAGTFALRWRLVFVGQDGHSQIPGPCTRNANSHTLT